MNTSLPEARALLAALAGSEQSDVRVVVAPPAPYLALLAQETPKGVDLAAQNCHAAETGAFTGEWSAAMLASAGVSYCILGHSERRAMHGETDALVADKMSACLKAGVTPIYCCGEVKEQRTSGAHLEVVESQVREALSGFSAEEMKDVLVAYEPVWAIGTGLTASDDQAQEMHAHIRSVLASMHGAEVAANTPILYGGSVKPSNAEALFAMPDVDGGLVGGASLKADDFKAIIAAHG